MKRFITTHGLKKILYMFNKNRSFARDYVNRNVLNDIQQVL